MTTQIQRAQAAVTRAEARMAKAQADAAFWAGTNGAIHTNAALARQARGVKRAKAALARLQA